jgi:hypothetical protein
LAVYGNSSRVPSTFPLAPHLWAITLGTPFVLGSHPTHNFPSDEGEENCLVSNWLELFPIASKDQMFDTWVVLFSNNSFLKFFILLV